jgi:DNA-binding transcriptional MerR regulator
MHGLLRCGEVAERCGVSPDTVRHYERLGLIPRATRTAAGYRQYAESACRRVLVVRGALRLGFTLRELGEVMVLRDGGGAPCLAVRRLLGERFHLVEAELRELVRLRRRLKVVMKDWDARLAQAKPGERVHLLEALVQED